MADAADASGRDRDRPPTIGEVAGQAGVSIATVSRVVSGRARVREATRLRVEQAIAATGWAVDPAARQLAGGKGDEVVLAVGVPDRREFASDPYYARVIAGAYEETARHGLCVSVHVALLGSIASLAPFSASRRYLGAVLVNAGPEEAAFLCGLGPPGARILRIGRIFRVNRRGSAGTLSGGRSLTGQDRPG